jgi:uncharacterized protein YnzC (UPF0291/DUF896 family)
MATLNYNKKYFPNIEWAASKKLNEFIEHEKHTGLSDAELSEAHALCVAAVEQAKPKKAKEPEAK